MTDQPTPQTDPLRGKDISMAEHSDTRSACPSCGEWRDSPTADCAGCGYSPDQPTPQTEALLRQTLDMPIQQWNRAQWTMVRDFARTAIEAQARTEALDVARCEHGATREPCIPCREADLEALREWLRTKREVAYAAIDKYGEHATGHYDALGIVLAELDRLAAKADR